MADSTIRDGICLVLSARLGLRIGLLGSALALGLFLFFSLLSKAAFHLTHALFTNLSFLFLIIEVADSILELELTFVLNLKGSLHLIAELHRAEVEVAKGRDRELAEDSLYRDEDRNLLMLLLLLTFKDDHSDVTALLGLHKLLFNLAHELNVDVDIFVRLKLALQRRNSEHLLGHSLLHAEVEADRVLALVLEVERKFLWLTDTDCSEVELSLNAFVKSDVEGFRVDVDRLLLLLDTMTLDIFDLKLDVLQELLLFEGVERDLDRLRLAWVKTALSAHDELLTSLLLLNLFPLLRGHRVDALKLRLFILLRTSTGSSFLLGSRRLGQTGSL